MPTGCSGTGAFLQKQEQPSRLCSRRYQFVMILHVVIRQWIVKNLYLDGKGPQAPDYAPLLRPSIVFAWWPIHASRNLTERERSPLHEDVATERAQHIPSSFQRRHISANQHRNKSRPNQVGLYQHTTRIGIPI